MEIRIKCRTQKNWNVRYMKLSILIPTLPERIIMFGHLVEKLCEQGEQFPGEVEILSDDRGREITTGQKRNELLQRAQGEYTVFVDDDDDVPEYYVAEIMKAIETDCDVIAMHGYITTNGENRQMFKHYLGASYNFTNGFYHRYPNHLNPMKRVLAIQVKFDNITFSEDYNWATELRNSGILKTQTEILLPMYEYKYITNK